MQPLLSVVATTSTTTVMVQPVLKFSKLTAVPGAASLIYPADGPGKVTHSQDWSLVAARAGVAPTTTATPSPPAPGHGLMLCHHCVGITQLGHLQQERDEIFLERYSNNWIFNPKFGYSVVS